MAIAYHPLWVTGSLGGVYAVPKPGVSGTIFVQREDLTRMTEREIVPPESGTLLIVLAKQLAMSPRVCYLADAQGELPGAESIALIRERAGN